MSAPAQAFWLKWVEDAFPDLDSRAYFLPPVYFNRVPMTRQSFADQYFLLLQSASGQNSLPSQPSINPTAAAQGSTPQPPRVQDSDVRDDAAVQRIFVCLQKMAEKNKEVFVGMTQLQFGDYLCEPFYAATPAQLPLPSNLPPSLPKNWKEGDFDFLVIHRQYGLIACEVKAVGDNLKAFNMSQQDVDKNIKNKLKQAVTQLDKAEAMLSHLVSDVAPGLRITKTIAVPNLTACQVQQAVCADAQLTQDLCRCLGTTDPADITGLCLCSDQLSDPSTPWDISSDKLVELENWWQRRVAGVGPDSHMTSALYKTLVARFCGPATTVTVPCTSPPRLDIKTLGQAVSWTGECYTALITLFPEQVGLLSNDPSTVFVTGPPGTGKSVVLLLKGIQWLQEGHDVHVMSTGDWSRAVCCMLHRLMLEALQNQNQTHQSKRQKTGVQSPGQVHLVHYDFTRLEEVERAVTDAENHLSKLPNGKSLYLIADEAGYKITPNEAFFFVFAKLLKSHNRIHLWAANCYHQGAPPGLQVEILDRPLRSPPVVVREVKQDREIIKDGFVKKYRERGVPDQTDGPPVKRVYHRGEGHLGDGPDDCVKCGHEVAIFLHSLRASAPVAGVTANGSPPSLNWRDMLVVSGDDLLEDSGVVKGLREKDILVQIMRAEDSEDVGTRFSDVVWVASGMRVSGLERKVVVCLDLVNPKSGNTANSFRLHLMSRCTSQLVIVSGKDETPELCP